MRQVVRIGARLKAKAAAAPWTARRISVPPLPKVAANPQMPPPVLGTAERSVGQIASFTPQSLYPQHVWGAPSGGEMNASSFAFRDLNRNGIYDLGDRPMANAAFVGRGPNGWTKLVRSNIDGFANYRMSAQKPDREITEPGDYSFELVVPPGWSVTTGNAVQRRRIRALPGAPGDLVFLDLPEPVGLAPDLTIRARLAASGQVEITAQGPGGQGAAAAAEGASTLTLPASPGRWVIEAEGAEGRARREVEVGLWAPVVLSALKLGGDEPPPAGEAHTLDFDDLVGSAAVLEMPNGYGGLNWTNWVAAHSRMYNGEGYTNGATSGRVVLYNSSGHPAKIWSERPFDFVGGYFTLGFLLAEGELMRVKAWRGETLAYEDAVPLSAMGPLYFAADYRGVTRIDIRTDHCWQAIADDLTFRLAT